MSSNAEGTAHDTLLGGCHLPKPLNPPTYNQRAGASDAEYPTLGCQIQILMSRVGVPQGSAQTILT